MSSVQKIPLYFNCFFFDRANRKATFTYKIEFSQSSQYPFQLFKLVEAIDNATWQNLSIYPSIRDCVCTFLKELYSVELLDEVDHGQATVNPSKIMEKIEQGTSIISIYAKTNNEVYRDQFDISFDKLIQRDEPSGEWQSEK